VSAGQWLGLAALVVLLGAVFMGVRGGRRQFSTHAAQMKAEGAAEALAGLQASLSQSVTVVAGNDYRSSVSGEDFESAGVPDWVRARAELPAHRLADEGLTSGSREWFDRKVEARVSRLEPAPVVRGGPGLGVPVDRERGGSAPFPVEGVTYDRREHRSVGVRASDGPSWSELRPNGPVPSEREPEDDDGLIERVTAYDPRFAHFYNDR